MARQAHGRIVLWQGGALWVFQVSSGPKTRKRTDFHAHHAIQVTLALDGAFHLHLENASLPGPGVVVSADVNHAFEPKGSIALLFVDPETSAGRALMEGPLQGQKAVSLPAQQTARLCGAIRDLAARDQATDDEWRLLGQTLIRSFAGAVKLPPADARIVKTLEWASANLDGSLGIADAAQHVGLSPDRMSHLFVEQTGLPFRTFVLWLRIQKAVDAYAHGASLTTAAYDAGFADSAHFSRTFRRMFGIAAAEFRLV
jgi:AraC-like DNA-binding protein